MTTTPAPPDPTAHAPVVYRDPVPCRPAALAALGALTALADVDLSGSVEFTMPPARNVFCTDHTTFFAKIATHPLHVEYTGARHAHAAGIPTPAPLAPPTRLPDGTWLLAYEHIPVSYTVDVHPHIPGLLTAVWSTPPPAAAVPRDWSTFADRAEANLLLAPGSPVRDLAATLSRTTRDTVVEYVTAHPVPWTWVHGDPHTRNVIGTSRDVPGAVQLLDWEWHGLGWRENDAAKYLAMLLTEPDTDHLPAHAAAGFCDAAADAGLDLHLVDLATRARAAHALTYQLAYGVFTERPDWFALGVDLAHRGLAAGLDRTR